MSKTYVDYSRLQDLLQGLEHTTTELSSPGNGEIFIEHDAKGWSIDDYMKRFAKWIDTPILDGRNRKLPCSMDALYIDRNGTLILVEFKKDRIFEFGKNGHCSLQLRSNPNSDGTGDGYRLWLYRKLTDTFASLAMRGVFPRLEEGKWRRQVKAYIVISAEANHWESHNPVARGIRRNAVNEYSIFSELRGYLFKTVQVIDEQAFGNNVIPYLTANLPAAN